MAQDNQPVSQQAQAITVAPPATATPKPSTPVKLSKLAMIQIVAFVIIGIWSVINIALLLTNRITFQGIIWALWWPAIFLVQYTVLMTPWRAITVKEIGRMFLIGMGLVFFASYWSEQLLVSIITAFSNINPLYIIIRSGFVLGPGVNIMADVASPICEETIKILPVILFLLFAGRGYWKRALGPLDVALLGGASGAGFFFMENIARVISGYWERLGPDRSSWVASPGFNPFYIFPDAYHSGPSIWLGHPEATMFIGLALGYGLFIRKKFKLWPIIPALGFVWVTWLHFMINGSDLLGDLWWGKIVLALRLNGGLAIYALELGLLGALAIAMITKYLYLKKDKEATLAVVLKELQEFIKATPGQPMVVAKKIWSLRHFWSFRHAVAYGRFYLKQQKPSQIKRKWIYWLADLHEQALGRPKYVMRRKASAPVKSEPAQGNPAT